MMNVQDLLRRLDPYRNEVQRAGHPLETNERDDNVSSELPPTVWEEMTTPNISYDFKFSSHIMHIRCFQSYYGTLIQ